MRQNEILKLIWDKVDLKIKMINLEDTDTKEIKPKDVPIGDKAIRS